MMSYPCLESHNPPKFARYETSLETDYRGKKSVFSRVSGVLRIKINLESFMRFLEIKG